MGMFGNRNLSAAQQVARGGDGVDPSTARPAFFGEGGAGRSMAGYIGDALLNLSGNKPVYAPMMAQQREQEAMLRRQMEMARYKAQNPDPTPMQRNYEYLQSQRPELAESYLNAEANPQTMSIDPATGIPRFAPKGGIPGMNFGGPQAPVSKPLPGGGVAYWVNGAWYDNPEGR